VYRFIQVVLPFSSSRTRAANEYNCIMLYYTVYGTKCPSIHSSKYQNRSLYNYRWWDNRNCPDLSKASTDETSSLQIENVAGVFFILVGGIAIAAVVCLGEYFANAMIRASKLVSNDSCTNGIVKHEYVYRLIMVINDQVFVCQKGRIIIIWKCCLRIEGWLSWNTILFCLLSCWYILKLIFQTIS
jgi:hypothetical protein